MCLAAFRVVSIAFKQERMLSSSWIFSFSLDTAIAFINFVLSSVTIEFRWFESIADIDSDLPWTDEHGWITLTVRMFDVSSHLGGALLSDVIQGERHSERELIENERRWRIKSWFHRSSDPVPVWHFGRSMLNWLQCNISKSLGSSVSEFHVSIWCETNKINIILARSALVVSYDAQFWH